MEKGDLLEEIEELLDQIKNEYFIILWNKLFEEEKINSVDPKDDLQSLLLEEIEYFEISKIIKIHKYLNSKV